MLQIPGDVYYPTATEAVKYEILVNTLGPVAWVVAVTFTVLVIAVIYVAVKWWTADEELHQWKEVADNLRRDYIKLQNLKFGIPRNKRITPISRIRSRNLI